MANTAEQDNIINRMAELEGRMDYDEACKKVAEEFRIPVERVQDAWNNAD